MLNLTKQSVKRSLLRQAAVVTPPPQPRQLQKFAHDVPQDETAANDFILSILHASPSARDSKLYLKSFGPQPKRSPKSSDSLETSSTIPPPQEHSSETPSQRENGVLPDSRMNVSADASAATATTRTVTSPFKQEVVSQILDPTTRHTGLIKIQGPFNDVQLESICRGMVYLEKLGLVSVIVIENDEWTRGMDGERRNAIEEVRRVVRMLEMQGARARPIVQPVARLGPRPGDEVEGVDLPEAHALPEDLGGIRSALQAGEIPVLAPFALDSFCRTLRIDANYVIAALARGMVEAAQLDDVARLQGERSSLKTPASLSSAAVDGMKAATKAVTSPYGIGEFDMTPLRLMIINREGGLPSYARDGLPHLLINLSSESQHIQNTFKSDWRQSHPTALSNLQLAKACLSHMPSSSSAIVVSHRSSRSLIANLITNKPERSSSLPHALLSGGPKKVTRHTPTLIRSGLPIRVIRDWKEIVRNGETRGKIVQLMESSFRRKLDEGAFFKRLEERLDFVIVAGDWAGAAIVTKEGPLPSASSGDGGEQQMVSYLDKFAVLPSHQGDGTVDFLWVALHDESYGLGLDSALNPNVGGRQGRGVGRDLVWRSRAGNPVNGWYFERSTGHKRISPDAGKGDWVLFWCDAEERLRMREEELRIFWEKELEEGADEEMRGRKVRVPGLSWLMEEEKGRLERWETIVGAIPSSWVAQTEPNL